MDTQGRKTITWVLIAAAAALSLFNVITYYATGAFGAGWFTASILIYGGLLVVALLFAITEPRETTPAPAQPAAEPAAAPATQPESPTTPTVLDTNVMTQTTPDGGQRGLMEAEAADDLEARIDREIAARLDAIETQAPPPESASANESPTTGPGPAKRPAAESPEVKA